MEKPTTTPPLPESPTGPVDPGTVPDPGASNATLIIFLGGIMLLLLICVVFILAAS